ncbi:MAG: TIGR01777 family oxidoreductase [Deltaproteobacteria bacterium]|nr:TIGR01777 family oxidoreductase [Deltaproteobacteria bacterium]MBW2390799.1 TIGR01777 family oxidoreductase [Deltaproteobacteria bacterium]MBW2723066.1 TIGR01777 family oxidoreductase [Deltaproteobacteria bacterium]
MRVFITGATGLLGRALCGELVRRGDEVVALSRKQQPAREDSARWVVGDPASEGPWCSEIDGADAVVHLAGESIAGGRWTRARKASLVASRVESTRLISREISNCASPPEVLICASATGYYGARGEQQLAEDAAPGDDFLAGLCRDWEAAAQEAASDAVRVVCLRFAVVLSAQGGALEKMLPPFRLGLGGPLGPKDRWFPWIHERDAVGLMLHALGPSDSVGPDGDRSGEGSDLLRGPVNAVAPGAVRMGEFASALGTELRRPAVLPVPLGALRLILGELAELLSPGQRVLADRALASGYRFSYPDITSAIRACLES